MLDKFDADKDGQLSDDERNAMKGEMEKRRAERPEGFRPGKRGERPESLNNEGVQEQKRSVDLLEQENINRFDSVQRNNKKRRKGNRHDGRKGNSKREKGGNPEA
jgi:hypothetical protein